jgi:site-specific recombinase XerD
MFDSQTLQVQSVVFTKSMLRFTQNGLFVTVFGVKNDVQRSGFEVFLPKHENEKLDPVRTLWDYVTRTDSVRSGDAVFLSLNKLYKALSASAVAKVLEESIYLAGLSEMGFSAKSFRPTGATVAIESGIDHKIVQKVGRWRSTEVFYQHYVHSRTPAGFSSKVLSSDSAE